MPSGPLAQDGGGEDEALSPTRVPMRQESGGSEPTGCRAGGPGRDVLYVFGVWTQSPGLSSSSAPMCRAH